MRILATIAIVAAVAAGIPAEAARPTKQPAVTVCMQSDLDWRVTAAQAVAYGILADAGVTIDWRVLDRKCPNGAIVIGLSRHTPASLLPGALAYAQPYEGEQIRVFYDRIEVKKAELVMTLLGHVLAHEITHLLQGLSRHSNRGVMKARWNTDDYEAMKLVPLKLAPEDVVLIQRGMAARAARFGWNRAPVLEGSVGSGNPLARASADRTAVMGSLPFCTTVSVPSLRGVTGDRARQNSASGSETPDVFGGALPRPPKAALADRDSFYRY